MAIGLPLSHTMSAAALAFCSEMGGTNGIRRPGLMAQARRGNPEAFAEMVSPHMPALYRRARRLTGNAADAEEVGQEALLKAWSRLDQFSGKEDELAGDFRAWISRIGANSSIDLLRQRRDSKMVSLEERRGPEEETLGSGFAAREANPEELCARREMGRLLADAIVRLPPDLRRTCLLRDVLHYSTQEVAQRLGISIVAVAASLRQVTVECEEQRRENCGRVAHRTPPQRESSSPCQSVSVASTAVNLWGSLAGRLART